MSQPAVFPVSGAIGVIGYGDVGQAFCQRAVECGYRVKVCNSREPHLLQPLLESLGQNAMATTLDEVVNCEIVLLAVPWDNVHSVLSQVDAWNGQILIDSVNTYHGRKGTFSPFDAGNFSTSQYIAQFAPGARVVKALNSLSMEQFNTPAPAGTQRVVFVSADDKSASQTVAALLQTLGLASIELGNLRDGGLLQQIGGPLIRLNLFLAE